MGLKKILRHIPQHVIDTTGMITAAQPINTIGELAVVRLPKEVSLGIRETSIEWGYLGLGYAYSKGRDGWDKIFNVNDASPSLVKGFSEFAYNTVAKSLQIMGIYAWNGVWDLSVWGTAIATSTVLAPIVGPVAGIGVDVMRYSTNMVPPGKESKYKFVQKIGRMTRPTRYAIAAGCIATSAGVMTATYNYFPDSWAKEPQRIEQPSSLEETLVELDGAVVLENIDNKVVKSE